MTDLDLRELERRWLATGKTVDEVPFLRARIRAGQVEPGKVCLASHLGHAAAQDVMDDPELAPLLQEYPAADLHHGLWVAGQEASVRACLAAAGATHALATADPRAVRLLGVLADWVLDPGEDARRLALSAAESTQIQCDEDGEMVAEEEIVSLGRQACEILAHDPERVVTVEVNGQELRKDVHFFSARDAAEVLTLAEHHLGEDGLDDVLHAEVVPWLLGYADPLRS